MNDNIERKKAIGPAEDLPRQRNKILSLTPEKALNAILDSPHPAAVVHSFSEEDFYFLIHDIGLEDSHLLLSLASDKQWEYIVDLEVWEKDRVEINSVSRWFDLLFKVDPNRFVQWLIHKKTELMGFYLFKNIEVKVRNNDQDPSDFSDEFFTFDDTFYIKFLDAPFDFDSGENDSIITVKEQRDSFLSRFFETLAAFDHVIYQKVLLESSSVIPAETEEEVYRLRNVRLAEKGFLPYEDAIGIYQSLKVRDFEKQAAKFTTTDPNRKLFLPVPIYPNEILEEESLFTGALKRLEFDGSLEQIKIEFAGLCNLVIAADQKAIREKDELRGIVKKVCGYINIGLKRLTKNNGETDVNRCSALIQKYPLDSIFKVGYGLALELKWRAEKWQERSWLKKEGLPLSFWGEKWLGVLGGLLIKKPLFFDDYRTDVLYREFISMEEITETENVLNEIIAFDDLLSYMRIKVEPVEGGFLTHKNLILTLWARSYLGLSIELQPLSIYEFNSFFDELWADRDQPRTISLPMKKSFLDLLAGQTGLTHSEITLRVGHTLENLFNELEEEYGNVSKKDLDPRYILLFLIETKKKNTSVL